MGRLTIATKFNTARLLQFVFPAVAMMMNFLPQPISTFMVNNDFRGIILWAVLFCTDLFDISSVFQGV